MAKSITPDSTLVSRFAAELDRMAPADSRLGLAVSGGPDSLALLVLAAAARPEKIEAATVDHALRPESAKEAEMVACLCKTLGVPHAVLTAEWKRKPETAIQERARIERYRLLARWVSNSDLSALVTGHHLDDQVETLLMRLNRGSGVRGLAGMRRSTPVPGGNTRILRPLLSWRRSELEDICTAAALTPAEDPGNADEQFERVRIRKGVAGADWLEPQGIARSASYLAAADIALHWAANKEWETQVSRSEKEIVYRPDAPYEIRSRIVRRSVGAFASEGRANPLRGRELERLIGILSSGRKATLRGVLCSGGGEWHFTRAPKRRQA